MTDGFLSDRPRSVWVAVCVLLAIQVYFVISNITLFFVFISVPMVFIYYRIWQRDNVARFTCIGLYLIIIGFSIYSFIQTSRLNETLTVNATDGVAIASQMSSKPSLATQLISLGVIVVPVIALLMPDSNRWYAAKS